MGRWALDVAFVWKAALTLGLVLLYYCFSIGITFYNKWLTKVTGPRLCRDWPQGGLSWYSCVGSWWLFLNTGPRRAKQVASRGGGDETGQGVSP